MAAAALGWLWLTATLATDAFAATPEGGDAGAPAAGTAPAGVVRLTLVGTNDWHGWVSGYRDTYGGVELRAGGAAAFGGYLRILREANPGGVVLVDAGDFFQGTLVANLTEGSAVIDAFNALGIDAAALGNHEFDYGPLGPASVAFGADADPFGALKARIEQARFPVLSANTFLRATGARPDWLRGDGTALVERNGVKVGVVGLTTTQTPMTTFPTNVASLEFRPLAPEAAAAAARLRARGADVVVAAVHAGGRCGDCSRPDDLSSCDADTAEIFEMLRALPEGTLDAVFAGHTHARIGHLVKGTPVVESHALGRHFGLIELAFDTRTRRVLRERTTLRSAVEICETWDASRETCDPQRLRRRKEPVVPEVARFLSEIVVPDAALEAALRPSLALVAARQRQRSGLEVPSGLERRYERESPLGSALADALRAMTKADVAVLNPGGLRADLPAGPLTYGAFYEVMPFDNAVATLHLTGAQVRGFLKAAFAGGKGVFQVSGLALKVSACPGPDRLSDVRLPDGRPLDDARVYRLVLPDFLAQGGDGLLDFVKTLDPASVDLGRRSASNLREELLAFLSRRGQPLVAPRLGRVTFVAAPGGCGRAPLRSGERRRERGSPALGDVRRGGAENAAEADLSALDLARTDPSHGRARL